ncbi:uncharacterized protein LOC128675951 isoform X2 [Plodia interpunctella]|uniref:uncharacterized protein LOC128675951 isoform X2 n=1 Tax=Plodia interpunctella TaxID=58824 RepID=UPI002367988C|nr:uncharacterized protein LOC128675951 isoform X2 [Plodia interpunctella]
MAINSARTLRNKIEPKESSGTMSESSNGKSQFMSLTITTTQSSINSDSRCKIARKKGMSPYLTGDKVKLSRVTEKKVVHKKPIDCDLSLPSPANVYRANSDEIRVPKRNSKKVKKSVLTLPNESNAEGIICTVSDVNDVTENNKDQRDRERKTKNRKRLPIQTRKPPRIREKDFEYYDRDARYCSQMNIDLDCSSTDMIKNFNGDGRRLSKKKTTEVSETDSKLDPHDVWAVLRNINQFQFTPSPPMSDYSIQTKKKKRCNRKRNNRKDARVIETCCTEEFAYISSYDVTRSRTSFSQASSIDRITVIDKKNEFSHFCQEFEKKFLTDSKNMKVQNKIKSSNQIVLKRNNKSPTCNGKPKEKGNQLMSLIDRKVILNKLNEDLNRTNAAKSNINTQNAGPLSLEYKEDIQGKNDLIHTNLRLSPYNATSCSVNSGSSKAGLNDFVNKTKAEGKSIYSDESYQQLKGITKVVLSKGPDCVVSKRTNAINATIRKPRLVTTMPPSSMPPKLTQTDIKRRLANKKFPIVVLEKDELGCSSIEVPLFEPIQFRGLDQHIWPFMRDWLHNDTKPTSPKSKSRYNHVTENTQHGKGKHTITNGSTLKEKRITIHNTRKIEPKRINAAPDTKVVIQEQAIKPKPIKQFKDKMLKLLYKKSIEDFTRSNKQIGGGQGDMKNQKLPQSPRLEKRATKVDAATDTVKILNQNMIQLNRCLSPQKEFTPIPLPLHITRHPWAKGKWASDFIDSVIKKVKSGIYYSQDKKALCKKCCTDSKEASIQTALTMSDEELKTVSKIEDIPKKESCYTKAIPGFDEVLAPVEIKTLNMKQITVKHCLTNVLLQFDVSVPTDKKTIPFESHRSLYTPLAITADSHSKIIKCKTTILNAIMPAELCSIIPKMMRNINFNANLQLAFPPILSRKSEQLATISELTQQRSSDSVICSITPFTFLSYKLRAFLTGNFPQSVHYDQQKRYPQNQIRIVLSSSYGNIVKQILNDIDFVPLTCYRHMFYPEATDITVRNLCGPSLGKLMLKEKPTKCMALQPYVPPKQCVAPTFGVHNVIKLSQHICFKNVVVNFDFPKYFPVMLNDIKITFHPSKSKDNIDVSEVLSESKSLKVDSLFNGYLKTGDRSSITSQNTNCIEFNKKTAQFQEKKQKSCQNLCHNKTKKKCFVRLYKKCKSTSNISMERSSTAICKITNLENFFQALGSGKLLSSIFDGYTEKKILKSIAQMKDWITEISQRQAMLVLLLTNKKDTPSLVRYRPVLLQGIAVNRITRASELDMEIEVIETENINNPQASDYQRPFDESSVKLLKSLTEKRKKLNPSYLRVMARYVGLGLLKPPRK